MATSQPVKPYGNGHINDTYLVRTGDGTDDYILQRINTTIFPDVPSLMNNISLVTEYLNHEKKGSAIDLVRTVDGNSYLTDPRGGVWRAFRFIPETLIYERITEPELAYEAGRAIGKFQSELAGMDKDLAFTIPRFHDYYFRKEQYESVLVSGMSGRIMATSDLRVNYEARSGGMREFYNNLGGLPVRVTHNDTKVNNILFDHSGKAVCMIDLDTVMPGYVHFDYGDALRTLTNRADEDEQDLSKVKFDLDLFHSFTKGYLDQAGGFLTWAEMQLLPFAPLYMTWLIGLRFLTDHLAGDVYYKTSYDGHNLIRAGVQMQLLREMENSFDEIILAFT